MRNGLIISTNGTKYYYLNDHLHRLDGPAVEFTNGDKWWYQEDKYHRVDGPAIESIDGYKAWYYRGKMFNCKTQKEFERLLKLKVFL